MLFAALARVAEQCVCKFNLQALANTAWAFVRVSQSQDLLFAVLAMAVEQRIGEFNPQGLANTAWAFEMAH